MANYKIIRISCTMVFQHIFAAGTCIGGCTGIILGILERDAVGILGGAFLGLVFGLGLGLFSMLCAEVFNVLVPYLGGISIELEEMPKPQDQPNIEAAHAATSDQSTTI